MLPLLVFVLLSRARAMKFATTHMVLPQETLSQLTDEPFALDVGGKISLNLTASLSAGVHKPTLMSVYIVVLDSTQLALATEMSHDNDQNGFEPLVCLFPYKMRVAVNEGPILWTSHHEGVYTIALLNCMDSAVFVRGHFEYANPGFENLSLESVAMVPTYCGLVILYAQLTLFWIFCLLRHRTTRTKLQLFLCGDMALKTLSLALNASLYNTMSTTGVQPDALTVANTLVRILDESSLLIIMLLTAIGWTITLPQISTRNVRIIQGTYLLIITLAILSTSCRASKTDESSCGLFKVSLYELVLYVVNFLILFTIIICTSTNLERLWNDLFSVTYRRDRIAVAQQFRIILSVENSRINPTTHPTSRSEVFC
eukprot:c18823_g1_i2.p1 GENE.c18823_g1_i2~~c18823_g1_i2.p1  ORF type:complete len:371 (-),score=68.25 c18823_g1_i2:512-1624(-)